MRVATLLAAVSALALGGAVAETCAPTTSAADATAETPAGTYYVDEDLCRGEDCIGGFWIYEEANGITGLQRRDEQRDDTCAGQIAGDKIIF